MTEWAALPVALHTGWYVCAELSAVSRQLHDGATVHTIALLSRKLALVPADMWIVSITGTLLQKMPCSSTKCHQIIKNGVWHATSASIIIWPLVSVRLQIHTNSYTHCDTDPWTHKTIVCAVNVNCTHIRQLCALTVHTFYALLKKFFWWWIVASSFSRYEAVRLLFMWHVKGEWVATMLTVKVKCKRHSGQGVLCLASKWHGMNNVLIKCNVPLWADRKITSYNVYTVLTSTHWTETFIEPSLNVVSKNQILTSILWNKMCGPWLSKLE
jgi:hypothetical protein